MKRHRWGRFFLEAFAATATCAVINMQWVVAIVSAALAIILILTAWNEETK